MIQIKGSLVLKAETQEEWEAAVRQTAAEPGVTVMLTHHKSRRMWLRVDQDHTRSFMPEE